MDKEGLPPVELLLEVRKKGKTRGRPKTDKLLAGRGGGRDRPHSKPKNPRWEQRILGDAKMKGSYPGCSRGTRSQKKISKRRKKPRNQTAFIQGKVLQRRFKKEGVLCENEVATYWFKPP